MITTIPTTPEAQFALAQQLHEQKDFVTAAKYYQQAADKGYAPAQFCLGYYYENAWGVKHNIKEALRLYRLAAAQNHVGAQIALGLCYANGVGVKQNHATAIQYFRPIAEQGDQLAQQLLTACEEILHQSS